MNDCQWPMFYEVSKIEDFFSTKVGFPCVLVPSGRNAITLLLSHLQANRGSEVFAPKWSSHCVWDAIGKIANPTPTITIETDFILAVHKWGYTHTLKKSWRAVIIEDSVDSILDEQALFSNGGNFEVLSLPKLIGSSKGGIIICKNDQDALDLRTKCELLEYEAIKDIINKLDNWEINKTIILSRLYQLSKKGVSKEVFTHRLPTLFILERDLQGFLKRKFNVARFLDEPTFKEVNLLPLHFGISDRAFGFLFEQI